MQSNIKFYHIWHLFIAALLIVVAISYSQSWTSDEGAGYIAKTSAGFNEQGWAYLFNWPEWDDGHPRVTRTLGNAFFVLDNEFRFWIFKWLTPHPSFSLSWIFLLFVNPLLVYKIIRLLQIPREKALLGAILTLSSYSTLAMLSFYFRGAKHISLTGLLLIIYMSGLLLKNYNQGLNFIRIGLYALSSVLLLHIDETLLFALVVSYIFWIKKENWAYFTAYKFSIFILYVFTLQVCIPYISRVLGFPLPHITKYQALTDVFTLRYPAEEYFNQILLFLSSSFGVRPFSFLENNWLLVFSILYSLIIFYFIIYALFKNGNKLLTRSVLAFLALVPINLVAIMHPLGGPTPVVYYFVFIPFISVFILTGVYQSLLDRSKLLTHSVVTLIIVCSAINFGIYNRTSKYQYHYWHSYNPWLSGGTVWAHINYSGSPMSQMTILKEDLKINRSSVKSAFSRLKENPDCLSETDSCGLPKHLGYLIHIYGHMYQQN